MRHIIYKKKTFIDIVCFYDDINKNNRKRSDSLECNIICKDVRFKKENLPAENV